MESHWTFLLRESKYWERGNKDTHVKTDYHTWTHSEQHRNKQQIIFQRQGLSEVDWQWSGQRKETLKGDLTWEPKKDQAHISRKSSVKLPRVSVPQFSWHGMERWGGGISWGWLCIISTKFKKMFFFLFEENHKGIGKIYSFRYYWPRGKYGIYFLGKRKGGLLRKKINQH